LFVDGAAESVANLTTHEKAAVEALKQGSTFANVADEFSLTAARVKELNASLTGTPMTSTWTARSATMAT
jgi:hypothetical protein